MKVFLVENTRKGTTIRVMLHNPPYENENVLYKTGYKEKDCIITEVHTGYDGDLGPHSPIDFEGEEE